MSKAIQEMTQDLLRSEPLDVERGFERKNPDF